MANMYNMAAMYNPFDRRAQKAHSSYPRVPFHTIRFFQLISSLAVLVFVSWFIWHLNHDKLSIPWTFFILLGASSLSVLALIFTVFLHCGIGLSPRLNIAINAFLSAAWAGSFGFFTYYISSMLSNKCDIQHWNEDAGVMVCRIYKALFTSAMVALLAALTAFGLDLYVRRLQTSRGIYRLQDQDRKRGPDSAARALVSEGSRGYGASAYAAGQRSRAGSEVWHEDSTPRPSMSREQSEKSGHDRGFSLPEIRYDDDTGYRKRLSDNGDVGA